jgi:hypothetical protein
MEINLHDPAVQAALIGALGTFLSAVVAAICASVIGKQFAGRKQLAEKLRHAIGDIAFLLAVEEEHLNVHRLAGESNKQRIRGEAVSRGFVWSGQFTPGRAKDLLNDLGESST